jgi:hypothetical protein
MLEMGAETNTGIHANGLLLPDFNQNWNIKR